MKFRKIDLIVPLFIIALCLTALITLAIKIYDKNDRIPKPSEEIPIIHYYDYIIEVDGTDSVDVYNLYNCEHVLIGSFTANNTDSLTKLITEDNE